MVPRKGLELSPPCGHWHLNEVDLRRVTVKRFRGIAFVRYLPTL